MHVLPLLLTLFFLPAISSASEDDQIVMSAGPDYTPTITPQPTLADQLTIEPSASIFYSYARELELSSIFSEPGAKVSLFVPTNKAIMALSRKPWVLDVIAPCWWLTDIHYGCRHQGAEETDDTEITEEQYDTRAKENVERWVSAHIIPVGPRYRCYPPRHLLTQGT